MYDSQFSNREEKEPSMKDVLIKISKKLGDDEEEKIEKKQKGFRFPWKARVGKKQLKNNYITVAKINENGEVAFSKEQIHNQTITIDGVPRLATGSEVLRYKGKPLIILPSWSVKPFSPITHIKETNEAGENTAGYELLLAEMKLGTIQPKKKASWWAVGIGVWVVVGIIIYAIVGG